MKVVPVLAALVMALAATAAADVDAARAKLEAVREAAQAPAPADPQAAEARARTMDEDLIGALRLFDAAGAAKSEDVAVLSDYAEALSRHGDHDLAAEALERAAGLAPEDVSLRVRLGVAQARTGPGMRETAVKTLRAAVALELTAPDAARAWYALGDLYHRERLFAFARECYEQVLAVDPEHVLARIGLAALDTREGDIRGAYARMDAVGRAAQPHDAHVRVLMRDALIDFENRRLTFADTADNHAAYANLLYRAGRIPEAVLAAERAARMRPEDFATLNFIAAMQLQMGNLDAGAKAYERSLEANPDQPGIVSQLKELRAYMAQQQEQGGGGVGP